MVIGEKKLSCGARSQSKGGQRNADLLFRFQFSPRRFGENLENGVGENPFPWTDHAPNLCPRLATKPGMTRTEKLLRELIALPSVNPALLPPNDPRGGEQRVGD